MLDSVARKLGDRLPKSVLKGRMYATIRAIKMSMHPVTMNEVKLYYAIEWAFKLNN